MKNLKVKARKKRSNSFNQQSSSQKKKVLFENLDGKNETEKQSPKKYSKLQKNLIFEKLFGKKIGKPKRKKSSKKQIKVPQIKLQNQDPSQNNDTGDSFRSESKQEEGYFHSDNSNSKLSPWRRDSVPNTIAIYKFQNPHEPQRESDQRLEAFQRHQETAIPLIPDIPQRNILGHVETSFKLRHQIHQVNFAGLQDDVLKQLFKIIEEEENPNQQKQMNLNQANELIKSELGRYNNIYDNCNIPRYMQRPGSAFLVATGLKTGKFGKIGKFGKFSNHQKVIAYNLHIYMNKIDQFERDQALQNKKKIIEMNLQKRQFKNFLEQMRLQSQSFITSKTINNIYEKEQEMILRRQRLEEYQKQQQERNRIMDTTQLNQSSFIQKSNNKNMLYTDRASLQEQINLIEQTRSRDSDAKSRDKSTTIKDQIIQTNFQQFKIFSNQSSDAEIMMKNQYSNNKQRAQIMTDQLKSETKLDNSIDQLKSMSDSKQKKRKKRKNEKLEKIKQQNIELEKQCKYKLDLNEYRNKQKYKLANEILINKPSGLNPLTAIMAAADNHYLQNNIHLLNKSFDSIYLQGNQLKQNKQLLLKINQEVKQGLESMAKLNEAIDSKISSEQQKNTKYKNIDDFFRLDETKYNTHKMNNVETLMLLEQQKLSSKENLNTKKIQTVQQLSGEIQLKNVLRNKIMNKASGSRNDINGYKFSQQRGNKDLSVYNQSTYTYKLEESREYSRLNNDENILKIEGKLIATKQSQNDKRQSLKLNQKENLSSNSEVQSRLSSNRSENKSALNVWQTESNKNVIEKKTINQFQNRSYDIKIKSTDLSQSKNDHIQQQKVQHQNTLDNKRQKKSIIMSQRSSQKKRKNSQQQKNLSTNQSIKNTIQSKSKEKSQNEELTQIQSSSKMKTQSIKKENQEQNVRQQIEINIQQNQITDESKFDIVSQRQMNDFSQLQSLKSPIYDDDDQSRNKRKSKFGFQFVDRFINNQSGLRGNSFINKPILSKRNKLQNIENDKLNISLNLNLDINEQVQNKIEYVNKQQVTGLGKKKQFMQGVNVLHSQNLTSLQVQFKPQINDNNLQNLPKIQTIKLNPIQKNIKKVEINKDEVVFEDSIEINNKLETKKQHGNDKQLFLEDIYMPQEHINRKYLLTPVNNTKQEFIETPINTLYQYQFPHQQTKFQNDRNYVHSLRSKMQIDHLQNMSINKIQDLRLVAQTAGLIKRNLKYKIDNYSQNKYYIKESSILSKNTIDQQTNQQFIIDEFIKKKQSINESIMSKQNKFRGKMITGSPNRIKYGVQKYMSIDFQEIKNAAKKQMEQQQNMNKNIKLIKMKKQKNDVKEKSMQIDNIQIINNNNLNNDQFQINNQIKVIKTHAQESQCSELQPDMKYKHKQLKIEKINRQQNAEVLSINSQVSPQNTLTTHEVMSATIYRNKQFQNRYVTNQTQSKELFDSNKKNYEEKSNVKQPKITNQNNNLSDQNTTSFFNQKNEKQIVKLKNPSYADEKGKRIQKQTQNEKERIQDGSYDNEENNQNNQSSVNSIPLQAVRYHEKMNFSSNQSQIY